MEFIIGEKFIEECEFKYFPPGLKDFNPFKTNLPSREREGTFTLYTHTHIAPQLFNEIKNYKSNFILVTHNSDHSISQDLFNTKPPNIIKWYAQNVNLSIDNLFSIPIGLENTRWFAEIEKKNKMIDKVKEPKNYLNLMYMNHNVGTNRHERLEPYQLFGGSPWVSSTQRINGQNFNDYIHNVYNVAGKSRLLQIDTLKVV